MKKLSAALLGIVMMSMGFSVPAFASDPNDAKVLVEQAQMTLRDFERAPEARWYHDAMRDAKGILVVPSLVKAGFIFGSVNWYWEFYTD